MNELFTDLPESNPSRLRAARIKLQKAQEHYDAYRDARDMYDRQTNEVKWEIGEAAHKLQDAIEEVKAAEQEELKR